MAVDAQQPTDQRGGAAHLVGLRWLIERRAQRAGVVCGGAQDFGPGVRRVPGPSGAGIPAAQLRCPAVEHQPVQPAEQPKRHGVARRVVLVAGEDGREDAAGLDVGGHQLEQLAVHPRAGRGAEPALRAHHVQQVLGSGGHRSSLSSPAPTTSNASPSAAGSGTDSSLSQCS